jgi:hypothetical protein
VLQINFPIWKTIEFGVMAMDISAVCFFLGRTGSNKNGVADS